MAKWTVADMPSQAGKTVIVTGSTSGIGYEAARAFAKSGARVVLAARNPDKGARVSKQIQSEAPDADLTFQQVDLGSLASVKSFAERIAELMPSVDILINNAGLMMIPNRQETEDGFERQFGTNHLGHFVLTEALWPLLLSSRAARVITVSSVVHRRGRLKFADINAQSRYSPADAYAQSKLANLVFAIELQRRIEAAGSVIASVAAHPGLTATNLYVTGQETGAADSRRRLRTRFVDAFVRLIGMHQEQGALSLLYAATAADVVGGGYYGPSALGEFRGWPAIAKIAPHALNVSDAQRLWTISEALTGVVFKVAA